MESETPAEQSAGPPEVTEELDDVVQNEEEQGDGDSKEEVMTPQENVTEEVVRSNEISNLQEEQHRLAVPEDVAKEAAAATSNQAEAAVSADQVEVKEVAFKLAANEAEPHQSLDMDSLEQIVPPESPKLKSPKALNRTASRLLGSFRQGMTRKDRVESMVTLAEKRSRKDRLGEGLKSVFQASMDDIGALGIGMQLYFMLTKYLSVAFLCMGIISVPAIMVNSFGHGITKNMVDPLQLAYSSIGNGGVNSDTAATARSCLPIGDIDCTWDTVNTPLTSNPKTVTWIVTISDVLYSAVFMAFLLFYSYRARKAIKEHQNKHLTPARYAVMVRGLPKDATEKEIMEHFSSLYDLNKKEDYRKLWFGCCWGRRHKLKRSRSLSKKAVNRNVVSNVDHLEKSTTINKELYKGSWIAEVSVSHPTGGLLRTFLTMEYLSQKKEETELLINILEAEKSTSLQDFKSADEKLIHSSKKKLGKILDEMDKKTRQISALKNVLPETEEAVEKKKMKDSKSKPMTSKEKLAAAAKAAKTAATNTQQAFDWEACECAFVVFNNLESRRRCLQDYRQSSQWLPHKWQPKELRFRGSSPLIVVSAPEPSNILWENLEVTNRGRFYRQSVTSFVTVLLLLISCAIISVAQSAQDQFASKMPPDGLCDRVLPAVYYADTSFSVDAQKKPIVWSLAWDQNATCSPGTAGDTRYHIAYTNGIKNELDATRLSYGSEDPDPKRCVDPCISESSTNECNSLPCFYYDDLVMSDGMNCEEYKASHVLYCFCSTALLSSIADYGIVDGPKKMWDNVPCRDFTQDYLVKNSFIMLAAGIIVVINSLLNTVLLMFADFERHTSESAKTIRVAVRMFCAQFLNTALIVIIVNAYFGLGTVPGAKELLGGKYKDFERGWYPTVGMGIATTMLLNAFLPQLTLFGQMYVVSPVHRWYKRRSIRTQAKMDKLYAGPKFDISERYPMVLNSVFVTMVFCGGTPVLLFIATVTSAGIYWFDKLSILHLYSVKTTYDEILGEVTLQVLPWTMALHLGFSAWMYGNSDLLKGSMLNLTWLLKAVGLSSVLKDNPSAEELHQILTERVGEYDILGTNGLLVKIIYSHVLLMTVLCFIVTFGLLLYAIFGELVFVFLGRILAILKQLVLVPVELIQSLILKEEDDSQPKETDDEKEKKPDVMLPEFTEPFLQSVVGRFRPDEGLGFQLKKIDNTLELTCVWPEDMLHENGIERVAGERKLTWETMQAPVKSYAIEANEKYRLAVERISEAWSFVKKSRNLEHKPQPVALGKVTPILTNQQEHEVENAVTATELVTVVYTECKKEEESAADSPKTTRPEEAATSPQIEESTSNNAENSPANIEGGDELATEELVSEEVTAPIEAQAAQVKDREV